MDNTKGSVTYRKRRGTDRIFIRIISYSLAIALLGTGFIINSIQVKEKYRRITEMTYARAFNELTSYMLSINTALEKTLYVSSAEQLVSISNELFKQTGGAKSCVGQLPITDESMDNMQKFLSQSGDYVYSLTRKVMAEGEVTDEERATLQKFSEYSSRLAQSLVIMQDGVIKASTPGAVSAILRSDLGDSGIHELSDFGSVEQIFTEYPHLIYDGPFSEHIALKPYQHIDSGEDVTAAQAKQAAADFFEIDVSRIEDAGKSEGVPECYSFTAGNMYFDVTVKGGLVYSMLKNTNNTQEKLTDEEALNKGKAFLVSKGFKYMEETYYVVEEGVLLTNLAHTQDGVICYPDLIKLGVDMESGDIVLYECAGYLQNNTRREIPPELVSEEQAKESVSTYLTIESSRLAIIPTEAKDEVLCYEFKCKNSEGQEFISYINAQTGKEQSLLVINDTGHGKLTM
ncbi:MAG: PepSY1/2 domain-containing protein [Eubacteriales bacterium]